MTRRTLIYVCFGVLAFVVACEKDNPLFCEGAPLNNCLNVDAPDDGPQACDGNEDCAAPTAVCDLAGSMTCVECTPDQDAACAGTTPVCGGTTCRGCTAHDQCDSEACLPSGACGDNTNVAYVDPTGTDNAQCTLEMPCSEVSDALATGRAFVKFIGTTSEEDVTLQGGRKVTFLAEPGAKLTRVTDGATITARGNGTELTIFDLEINNNFSPTGVGIVIPAAAGAPKLTLARVIVSGNPGGGISADGGTVTITQSIISGNPGGGISIDGSQFEITNNIITSNGGAVSELGGVEIGGIVAAGTHELQFNTITANLGPATVNTGITCGTVLIPLTFSNNIVFANLVAGTGRQIGGSVNCSATFSNIGPDTLTGTGNINSDPMFVNISQGDFHLTPNSPSKDVADPDSLLGNDIDGDSRPQGVRRDMGADEVVQ